MEEQAVISSYVVEAAPGREPDVTGALATLGPHGVEVQGSVGPRLVVTVEAPSVAATYDVAKGFATLPGVLNVSLVYANFEDDPSLSR